MASLVSGRDRASSVFHQLTMTNPSTNEVYRTTTDKRSSERVATERASFLERTTDLTDREALALGYREQGYSSSAIARFMDSTKQTIKRYMDRIVVQYGLEAIETKPPDDHGDLEPVTVQRLGQLSDAVLEQWLEAAADHPDQVPVEVDLDRHSAIEDQQDSNDSHQVGGDV